MKFIFFITLILFLTQNAFTQTKTPNKRHNEIRPATIVNLINSSNTLPAETATEILIKVAKSKQVKSKKWRLEILNQAFRVSDEVQNSFRKKIVPLPGISVDNRSGYLTYAFNQKLDELSLKSEIISETYKSDKPLALQMLSQINLKLQLKPLNCVDTMVYDISDFYKLISEISKKFNKKEINEGIRLNFLLRYVENISSHIQLKSILELLLSIKPTEQERLTLGVVFFGEMKSISPDDRSFTYAVERDRISSLINRMTFAYSQPDLINDFKAYLIKNSNKSRCAENSISNENELPFYITDSNRLFGNKPIKYDDVKTTEIDDRATVENYWQSKKSKEMLSKIKELRRAKQRLDAKTDDSNLVWQSNVSVYLDEIESWTDIDVNELTLFNEKCVIFRGLSELTSKTSLEKQVVNKYLDYLNSSIVQNKSYIEWLVHVRWLVDKYSYFLKDDATININPTINTYLRLVSI